MKVKIECSDPIGHSREVTIFTDSDHWGIIRTVMAEMIEDVTFFSISEKMQFLFEVTKLD